LGNQFEGTYIAGAAGSKLFAKNNFSSFIFIFHFCPAFFIKKPNENYKKVNIGLAVPII
jgi:hypothetical protein